MIKIIADTTCGIPVSALIAEGIEVLPQIITFGSTSYRDDTEIDTETFLKKLRASESTPKTAAPPHTLYTGIYQKILDAGHSILVITPSGEVSGTYRSAMVAAKDFDTDRIQILDSKTIGSGLGSIVLQAKRWADDGMTMTDLLPKVANLASREKVFFMVPTLDYLYKGGRIGGAAKLFGTILQIIPILTMVNGRVEPFEKVRTLKQANARMVDLVNHNHLNQSSPLVTISHCDNLTGARRLKKELEATLHIQDIPIYLIPPAIVVHAGPDLLGVSTFLPESIQ